MTNYPMFRWWGWRSLRLRFKVAYHYGIADGTVIDIGPLQITVGFMDSGLRAPGGILIQRHLWPTLDKGQP